MNLTVEELIVELKKLDKKKEVKVIGYTSSENCYPTELGRVDDIYEEKERVVINIGFI